MIATTNLQDAPIPSRDPCLADTLAGLLAAYRKADSETSAAFALRSHMVAHADEIIDALNRRDELVEALEWALNDMQGMTKYTNPDQWHNCMDRALIALDGAKGAA